MRKKRGIVLITTMLFVTVIVMIATLIATQGKMALQSGTISMQSEEAYMAALSGIDFVRGELRKDRSFGNATLTSYTHKVPNVATNGVLIKYIGNDLWGYMGATSENNYKSKFVISFAKPTNTAFNNTNFKHTTSACKYVSVNNVSSNSTIDEDIDNGIRRKVPPYTMYVVSKGVCGKSVRYAEAILTSNGPVVVDNGTTIGGNITIQGDDKTKYTGGDNSLLTLKHSDPNNPGQLNACNPNNGECKGTISLEGTKGNNLDEDLLNLTNKVVMNGIFDSKIKDQTLASNLSVSQNAVVNMEDLNSLKFEDAKNAVGDNWSPTLKAGSYIYTRQITGEGDNKKVVGHWCYVEDTDVKDAIKTLNKSNNIESYYISKMSEAERPEGIVFGTSDSQQLSKGETRTVIVNGNLTTFNNGNVNFAVADMGVDKKKFALSDCSVDFQLNKKGSISVNKGDLNIKGEVTGNGNLIANGNIEFNAGSAIEVDKDQKVAVWADQDVNINRAKNVSNKRLLDLYASTETVVLEHSATGDVTVKLTQDEIERMLIGETGDLANANIDPETNEIKEKTNDEIYGDFNPKDKSLPCDLATIAVAFEYNSNVYIVKRMSGSDGTKIYKMSIEQYESLNNDNYSNILSTTRIDNKTGEDTVKIAIRWDTPEANSRRALRQDYNIFLKYKDKYYYYKTFNTNNNNEMKTDNENYKKESDIGYIDSDRNGINGGQQAERGQQAEKSIDTILVEDPPATEEQYTTLTNEDGDQDKKPLAEVSKSEDVAKIANKIVNSDTKLRGTVYSANGNIKINIGNTCFDIIGALIAPNAKKEGLYIKAKKVDLTYDPDYVPFFSDLGVNTNVGFLSSFVGGEN